MITTIFQLLAALCLFLTVQSQPGLGADTASTTKPRSGMTSRDWIVGPEGGLNFAFASVSNEQAEGSARKGFIGGLSIEKKITTKWSFVSGLRYTQSGVKTQLLSLLPGTIRLNYIQFPIAAKVKLTKTLLVPYFYVGGTLGYALSRNIELLSLVELDLSERFTRFDVSIDAGAGFEFPLISDFIFSVGMHVAIGIKDISNAEDNYHSRNIALVARIGTAL